MKTTILTLGLLLGLVATAQAQTIYTGTIDLTKASNNARIPTEINAGAYSVEISLRSSRLASTNDISLSKSFYRDDNERICEINGAFKVGEAFIKVKSLTSNWVSNFTKDVYVYFGSRESASYCEVNARIFEGRENYTIHPQPISFELPVKDARFSSVKLSINPIVDGFKANYELIRGDQENTLRVLNPGLPFENALQSASRKTMSYALSLTAGGYYHFDTQYTSVNKLK
ncbi:hypothetical protein ACJVC5_14515 [Peredibacter sp. HCB2-198]|uniref:hypothetical protein n=1 Tax=Peredibacter sp. HCB2-198 TaxID=3383025 RepID=UPI0038B60005